jgi:hypothetical protein
MNQSLDDKSRFVKVLKLLPEKFVDYFVCDYLYNASYPKEANTVLSEYAEYKKEIISEFSNSKINDAYINLNKSFDMLTKFLTEHFWIPNDHYKMYESPPFFYLEPRIHHNFGGENKDPILWDKYKNELDEIADEFKRAYKNFIKIAKNKIEQKEEILKLSPEIHGVGINLRLLWEKIKSWF